MKSPLPSTTIMASGVVLLIISKPFERGVLPCTASMFVRIILSTFTLVAFNPSAILANISLAVTTPRMSLPFLQVLRALVFRKHLTNVADFGLRATTTCSSVLTYLQLLALPW